MTPMVAEYTQQLVALNAFLAGADFVGAKLHLGSNIIVPTPTSVLADFTECIFTGYAPVVMTWGAAYIGPDGKVYLDSSVANFLQTAITATDSANNWYLTDSAGTLLLFSGALDGAPIGFGAVGTGLGVVLKMAYDPHDAGQITL